MFGFLKGASSKQLSALPVLGTDGLNTVTTLCEAINDYVNVSGLYKSAGNAKAVAKLEKVALSGKFSHKKLDESWSPKDPHVLTGVLKNILSSHQPLVPADLYEVVTTESTLAGVFVNLTREQKDVLDLFLRHLWVVSNSPSANMDATALAEALAQVVLRPPPDATKTAVKEDAIKGFIRLIEQKATLFRARGSLPEKSSISKSVEQKSLSETQEPAQEKKFEDLMTRSVRITFPKDSAPPDDEDIINILSLYGTVNEVGSKSNSKSRIVLFSKGKEAVACYNNWHAPENSLGNFKIAYLGDAELLKEKSPSRSNSLVRLADSSSFQIPGNDSKPTPREDDLQSLQDFESRDQDDVVDNQSVKAPQQRKSSSDHSIDDDARPSPVVWQNATKSGSGIYPDKPPLVSRLAETTGDVAPFHSDAESEEEPEDSAVAPILEKKPASPTVRKLHPKVVKVGSSEELEASQVAAGGADESEPKHETKDDQTPSKTDPNSSKQKRLIQYDSKGRCIDPNNPILNKPLVPERNIKDSLKDDGVSRSVELPQPVPDFGAEQLDTSVPHHARSPDRYVSRWSGTKESSANIKKSQEPEKSEFDRDGDVVKHVPFVAGLVDKVHKKANVARGAVRRGHEKQLDPDHIADILARALLMHHEAPEPVRQYVHRPPAPPYTGYPVHVDLNINADRRHQSPPRFASVPVDQEDHDGISLRSRPIVDPIPDSSHHRVSGDVPMPRPVLSAASGATVRSVTDSIFRSDHGHPSSSEVTALENRLRYVEAELKARVDRAKVDEAEQKRLETAWAQELTANRIRISEQQNELQECHDTIRKLRTELACRDGEISSLSAARDAAQVSVGSAKSKAEREAMSTVLSQQRLLGLIEEERDSLLKKNAVLEAQVEELVKENKQLQIDGMEWRTKALATEQAFAAFAGEQAVASAKSVTDRVLISEHDGFEDNTAGQERGLEKRDSSEQATRYIDKKNRENPGLLSAYDRGHASDENSSKHIINRDRRDSVPSDAVVPNRPDTSRRIREELNVSRARVESALNYQPRGPTNRQRSVAEGWAPRAHSSRYSENAIESSYQPRTPELKEWLRGGSKSSRGAPMRDYY